MPFNVVLSKNAKVNGEHYKAGQTVENVADELFEELEMKNLVSSSEKVQAKAVKSKANSSSSQKAGE